MDSNTSKRRKIDHENGSPDFEVASTTASSMGASGASAFILETEELLSEVKYDYSKTNSSVQDTLRRVKDIIEASEPHEPHPIGDLSAKFEKSSRITIPYPDPAPAKDAPYKLSFETPAQINVVGSWIQKTNIKSQSDVAIDMIVVMPTSIFQEKDYLNMRYFFKRAYYLAYITSSLRQALGPTMEFTFGHLHGNLLLPILDARPKDKSTPPIRIIPCAPEDFFPAAKITAISNAIRQSKSETDEAKTPTPFYNTTLKAESQFTSYLRLLHRTSNSCAAFNDACILGRIWLQQRGFSSDLRGGGFGHFEWAALVALLLQGGGRKGEAVLSSSLHSTQLFKATLQYIVSANLQKKVLIIGKDAPDSETLRQTMPVLYDAARGINILYKMSPWSISMLTEQAKWSLSAINDSPLDQFDPLFIIKADQPLQMFDVLLSVDILTSKEGIESVDRKGFVSDFSVKLYNTLTRALGDRAQLIHIHTPESAPWPISASIPKEKRKSLLVGIVIDPLKASQGREYGPSYEQKKEAARFRDFWGKKADLWQFQDGNIVESLDWSEFSYLGSSGICEGIIRYILNFRLQLEDKNLEFYWRDIPKVMAFTPSDKLAFDSAKQAFDIVERDIRDLEDLPLHVKQMAPICSDLRRTSLNIPEFNFRQPLLHPMEIVISFEVSGKWPESLAAIQRAKIAFLLKIGSSLEALKDEIRTHLGIEDAARDDENLAFLDIVYENGASFRLQVHSDLEETLLERKTKDQTVERHVRTEAADLLSKYRRMYINLPLHNQTISTFCTRFPALSSSIRLTKHWFNSHMLSCHFREELIELFVLQAFLKPYPWQTPCSAMTGFLRTMLLLSRWDWRDEPLVIDSADSLSTSQRVEIGTRLEAWRKIDPNMNRTVLFVATSHDVSGIAYTLHGPTRVVATRMTSLARSACKAVREKSVDLNIRTLFQSSPRDYDVLLHLSPKILKSIARDDAVARRSQFKNLDAPGPMATPLALHPARMLLKRLNELYGAPLLFFHGAPDDAVIAGLWNPLLHRRTFTAHAPCSLIIVEKGEGKKGKDGKDKKGKKRKGMENAEEGETEELFEVNKNAILAEIARIGGDVIEKIEVKEDLVG
ncbi:Nrap protein [Annulohypoxylon maeteangense]|uniref:Nrap protein n=1 Tax=Annulohypoxylon maeteangense TaxID=1927788 RepID=UPI0020086FD0|nr:Nrap protein [Annulohypoxylon maeteangense]KAI0880942.1 Nrap protein [Annulohypoxylon maeteangense]